MLVAPPLLGAALLAIATVSVQAIAAVDAGTSHRFVEAVMALAVVPVSAAAAWLGWRVRQAAYPAGWLLFVPTLLALSMLAMASAPYIGEILGETWTAAVLAIATWGVLLTGLAAAVRRLAARIPSAAAVLMLILAGLAILELTFVAYSSVSTYASTEAAPYLWYPSALTSYDFGLPHASTELSEELKLLPSLLTTCTAFTLGACHHGRPSRPGAA